MNAIQMWQLYSEREGITCDYDAWAFGEDPDQLAHLVLTGIKTATASAFALYEAEGEPIPEVGQYSVILNSRDEAVCIIRTEKVFIAAFDKVGPAQARMEGEGDRSLGYWRTVHEAFFRKALSRGGLEFTPDMPVVCEEFVRVFP